MPLLKRKRFALVDTPPYDKDSKDSRNTAVWFSPLTKEIFTDYSEYLRRTSLYKKSVWQCASSGKSNLTYKEAMESEKHDKDRVQEKIPELLQKRVLEHIQFSIARLESIVEDAYQYFVNRYAPGEIIHCLWDDNIAYNAKILELSEKPQDDIENDIVPDRAYYKVQLIDENSEGIDQEDCIKVVGDNRIKRDRYAFSKNLLRKFIREYASKDTYIGAPWVVKPEAAKRFGISQELPKDLQLAKDSAYSKSRKKRKEASTTSPNGNVKEEAELNDARRIESTLKYPVEDLNVPSYRRDPNGNGPLTDMTPGTKGATSLALNPTGGMPLRPAPNYQSTVPTECIGSFLMVWSFLGNFSQPLKLSPFSLDDFENALRYDSATTILTESNIALLNAVILQRDRLKKESLGHGPTALAANIALYGTGYLVSRTTAPAVPPPPPTSHPFSRESSIQYNSEDDDDHHDVWKLTQPIQQRISTVERGCGSAAVEYVSLNWDHGTVDTEAELDRILNMLVPSDNSTLEEREQAYSSLSLRDKIILFELLINVANESFVIKNYLDECQDQLTELRKQKIDLSRERKRIRAEKIELEDKQNGDAQTETNDIGGDSDSEDDASDNEDSALLKAQRRADQLSRLESRQAAMKRRQAEREEQETKRIKLHHIQREEQRARQVRNEARRKLDEEERVLHRKEEQLERDMRKYSLNRIKPLGRDKFYNRYYYFDDIGGTLLHGSGKLYVQSPSDTDLMVLQERDVIESIDANATLPCGRGGGVKFVSQLMKEQGLVKEAEFLESRIERLKQNKVDSVEEWWQTYDEPENILKLIEWLNPKGIREFRLRRELEKQMHNLTLGMKKRVADQSNKRIETLQRRSTRHKSTAPPSPQFPLGSWLAYTNKLAFP
ncbi:hypothetical protein [Parasitella parasitica]|uniref:WAC domain-containing protein n=1 Tax=Parasitella parasitica TaxID=35722 RepID=A0A0B7MQZ4_9FUNG|nr:hypothetical protein [Parasitella parasitica]